MKSSPRRQSRQIRLLLGMLAEMSKQAMIRGAFSD